MSGEGFLSRWSRRKRAAEREPDPPAPEEAVAAPPAEATPLPAEALPAGQLPAGQFPAGQLPAEEPPAGEPIDLASLPSIEDLTAESDVSAFLRPGVPAWLRTAALRRMWSLDPEIRSFVGPADYAWDYNAPDGVPGFSLELGGDVKRLLAQAIGLDEDEPKEARPDSLASADGVVEPPDALALPPPEAGRDPMPEPSAEPEPEPPLQALADAEPEAPRRRHGGALPS